MGRQVAIAQTRDDEYSFFEWLCKRDEWLCLPRLFSDPNLDPLPIGEYEALELVVFLKSSIAEVIGNIQPLSNDPYTFHVRPREGLCFEWNRSQKIADSGYTEGRFYYENRDAGWLEIEKHMTRHFNALLSLVKKTYPLMTNEKKPTYIGPVLSFQILSGIAIHCWKSGKPISVVQNPKRTSPV